MPWFQPLSRSKVPARVVRWMAWSAVASIVALIGIADLAGAHTSPLDCSADRSAIEVRVDPTFLFRAQIPANVMYELDGSKGAPYTPRETAEISKAFCVKQGYTFRS